MTAPPRTVPVAARTAPTDDEERNWRNWLTWLETPAGQDWMERQLDRLNPPLLSKEYDPAYLMTL